ncbi:MAG TPA: ferritin family protein [Mycoplana sp.]|nr:ferritin family protein [Mycoplana sp.]
MTKSDPWIVGSMNEVLALARSMEMEAISGYAALARRMRDEDQPALAAVFEALVSEEQGHLDNVEKWIGTTNAAPAAPAPPPQPMFDDEGAALVAPELLNSYRAFSMAVRNEERAFVFWTYVAAHAPTNEIREAAERMAREELGHVATLRRERRRAFHAIRDRRGDVAALDLAALEQKLADHLANAAGPAPAGGGDQIRDHAHKARERAAAVHSMELAKPAPEPDVLTRLVPLCEYVLDYYLDLAEHARDESLRQFAQACAGDLVACLHAVRALPRH